jgi:hypothetical protein
MTLGACMPLRDNRVGSWPWEAVWLLGQCIPGGTLADLQKKELSFRRCQHSPSHFGDARTAKAGSSRLLIQRYPGVTFRGSVAQMA